MRVVGRSHFGTEAGTYAEQDLDCTGSQIVKDQIIL
jgi:hypothetical protein